MAKLILKDVPTVVIDTDSAGTDDLDAVATITIKIPVEKRTFGRLWWKREVTIYKIMVYEAVNFRRKETSESYEVH